MNTQDSVDLLQVRSGVRSRRDHDKNMIKRTSLSFCPSQQICHHPVRGNPLRYNSWSSAASSSSWRGSSTWRPSQNGAEYWTRINEFSTNSLTDSSDSLLSDDEVNTTSDRVRVTHGNIFLKRSSRFATRIVQLSVINIVIHHRHISCLTCTMHDLVVFLVLILVVLHHYIIYLTGVHTTIRIMMFSLIILLSRASSYIPSESHSLNGIFESIDHVPSSTLNPTLLIPGTYDCDPNRQQGMKSKSEIRDKNAQTRMWLNVREWIWINFLFWQIYADISKRKCSLRCNGIQRWLCEQTDDVKYQMKSVTCVAILSLTRLWKSTKRCLINTAHSVDIDQIWDQYVSNVLKADIATKTAWLRRHVEKNVTIEESSLCKHTSDPFFNKQLEHDQRTVGITDSWKAYQSI